MNETNITPEPYHLPPPPAPDDGVEPVVNQTEKGQKVDEPKTVVIQEPKIQPIRRPGDVDKDMPIRATLIGAFVVSVAVTSIGAVLGLPRLYRQLVKEGEEERESKQSRERKRDEFKSRFNKKHWAKLDRSLDILKYTKHEWALDNYESYFQHYEPKLFTESGAIDNDTFFAMVENYYTPIKLHYPDKWNREIVLMLSLFFESYQEKNGIDSLNIKDNHMVKQPNFTHTGEANEDDMVIFEKLLLQYHSLFGGRFDDDHFQLMADINFGYDYSDEQKEDIKKLTVQVEKYLNQ